MCRQDRILGMLVLECMRLQHIGQLAISTSICAMSDSLDLDEVSDNEDMDPT